MSNRCSVRAGTAARPAPRGKLRDKSSGAGPAHPRPVGSRARTFAALRTGLRFMRRVASSLRFRENISWTYATRVVRLDLRHATLRSARRRSYPTDYYLHRTKIFQYRKPNAHCIYCNISRIRRNKILANYVSLDHTNHISLLLNLSSFY
jgi:hypothetical protein